MNQVVIGGQAFDYNPFDPGDAVRMAEAERRLRERVDVAENGVPTLRVDGIVAFCEAMIEFFDEALGAGAARRIFGDETDALRCLDAYLDLVESGRELALRRGQEVAVRHEKLGIGRVEAKYGA